VIMPQGSAQGRANQLATLAGLEFELFTSEEIGALLQDLNGVYGDYDSDEASIVRVLWREWEQMRRLPPDLTSRIQEAGSVGRQAWVRARETNDFALFKPHLEKMIDLQVELAEAIGSASGNRYDALLHNFEPGLTFAYIDSVFRELKPELIALTRAVAERADAVDDSVLKRHYPEVDQLRFGEEIAAALGYDFQRGRLDLSPTAFTSAFHKDDVRITTRINADNVLVALGGIIHEAGHGIHRQSLSPSLYRSGIDGTGLAIAETLSRYYENVIGLSYEFWTYFFPRAQAYFPHLADTDLITWYRAFNKAQPSLIRTDADEVTYGLHIMIRFELENELINGRMRVDELPAAWNARMETYLGIVPPTDREGVLQDTHWSQGGFGYFPDYLLGTIFASQLDEQISAQQPDIKEDWTRGDFAGTTGALVERIMQHGGKYTFGELIRRNTGEDLSAEPYLRHLKTKYGAIYEF
jgi:carboxypeptidase Taq